MKLNRILFLGFILATLSGCAHSIDITPSLTKIEEQSVSASKVKSKVGFYIPEDVINIEITSAGGGGDNVRYFPYKNIETGYMRMLTNVFEEVIRFRSANEVSDAPKQDVKYVIEPVMVTTSGSTGFFTWPPTNFTVDLTSNMRDKLGKTVANPRVIGNGQVDFILDMHGDYGLAGRLAMEDAILKMQRALLETDFGNIATKSIPLGPEDLNFKYSQSKDQISIRLEKLKDLLDKSLISREDYENKKRQILDGL